MIGLLAIGLAAAGAALAVPPRVRTAAAGPGRRAAYLLVAGGAAGGAWWLRHDPRLLVLAAIGAAAVAGAVRLVLAHRQERSAAVIRARVVETCEGLHADLAVGQTPHQALARAAHEWPLLATVSRTGAAGGDVPTALRELAGRPGAGDLAVVAAAWQVAHRTGHGLGDVLCRVGQELRDADRTRRVVTGELASARATARLVAALPVAALVLGSGAGADPAGFLLAHPVGLACLAGGLACGMAGLAWIEALARDVERGR